MALADYFVDNSAVIQGRSVLELGAGAALPSLVALKVRPVVSNDSFVELSDLTFFIARSQACHHH